MSRIMPSLSDGRCFTNYLNACTYDQRLQNKFGQRSEPAFRRFLQANAQQAQQETRKLHICNFAFDTLSTGPALGKASYAPADLREWYRPAP